MRLRLAAPAGFDFRRTVLSHGWYGLDPFGWDAAAGRLEGALCLDDEGALPFTLAACAGGVSVTTCGAPGAAARRTLRGAVRRILGLDLEFGEFHDRARQVAGLEWIADCGAGRLLRAPTAFEDLVKLILTTNCSWAATRGMTTKLVRSYGERGPNGSRAFPGPAAIARAGEQALRDRVRAGYRAPALARLAREVLEGRVLPETWEADARDADELRRVMLELPGVGPYVAENLLRLNGRPQGLALDSWLRARYARVYHGGRRVTDRTIARRYARMGEWAGLALWCDMTRDWLDGEASVVVGA